MRPTIIYRSLFTGLSFHHLETTAVLHFPRWLFAPTQLDLVVMYLSLSLGGVLCPSSHYRYYISSREASFSELTFLDFQISAFISAVILLLNIWSGKRSGHAPNYAREMQGVQRCLEILKVSERK